METTVTEVSTLVTETVTSTVNDLSAQGVDVDLLNAFLYLGTTAIIAGFFWFVCKWLYKLFNMFF